MSDRDRYGPWAVVAGASEGTGASFAHAVARRGINCILIARDGPLEAVAQAIRDEHGVEAVIAWIDLSTPDAFDKILAAVGDREIGLYVGNAGTDPFGLPFLDGAVEGWLGMVGINAVTTLRACHHFGREMRARKRGGLLLVNSGACYGGSPFLATYTACKGFQLNLVESLWAELAPHDVDVLTLVLGQTDTPAYHRLQAKKGMPPSPRLASPDDVAEAGLTNLPNGPIHNIGLANDDRGNFATSAEERRGRVLFMGEAITHVFGPKARITAES